MSVEHEKRLGHVERAVAEMRGRLGGVESKLDDVAGGVQQLLRRDAERSASEPISLRDMLGMAVHAAALIGLAVSAIVYVAGGYYSADIAVMKYKLDQALVVRGWSTSVTRGK